MEENLNAHRSIRTFSGNYVNVFEPDPNTLVIDDIAHSLSMQPRFGGHCQVFYSVAEHSIWVAKTLFRNNAPIEVVYSGLMHDASEAYLIDMPKPIKVELPDYNVLEDRLMLTLSKEFHFQYPLDPQVKIVDQYALEYEWYNIVIAKEIDIKPMTQPEAKEKFYQVYCSIRNYSTIDP